MNTYTVEFTDRAMNSTRLMQLTDEQLEEEVPRVFYPGGYELAWYVTDQAQRTTDGPYCYRCTREMVRTSNYFIDDDRGILTLDDTANWEELEHCLHCNAEIGG
jgi:hypothetical protein